MKSRREQEQLQEI